MGDQLPLARAYAERLCGPGTEQGLIGPREVERIWERHVGNCAVVGELLVPGTSVIDVGSGAGLPGVALAVTRPDLDVTLVESMQRRVRWLEETVAELGLEQVTVVRARAEEVAGQLSAKVVTSRAVAPLEKLARWSLPLVAPGGQMMALKGAGAQDEVRQAMPALRRAGASAVEVLTCGERVLESVTTVVKVSPGRVRGPGRRASKRPARS